MAQSVTKALADIRSYLRALGGSQAPTIRVGAASAVPSPASTVIADTGQLAAGAYRVEISMSFADTVAAGKGMVAEHRNAANNATTAVLGGCPAGAGVFIVIDRIVLATNERVRVATLATVGAANSISHAHIAAYPVT